MTKGRESGGYERKLAAALCENGYRVAIVNPHRMRRFADARGKLAKTDAIDARTIAHYGAVMDPAPWRQPDPAQAELKELATRRLQLISQRTAERNRLQTAANAAVRRMIRSSITHLGNQIERLELAAREVICASPDLKSRYELARSVPGAGPVLALSVTAFLPCTFGQHLQHNFLDL